MFSCLSYSACKLRIFSIVLYSHLWPVWLYKAFSSLFHKWHNSRKKIIEKKTTGMLSTRSTVSYTYIWSKCHVQPGFRGSSRVLTGPRKMISPLATWIAAFIVGRLRAPCRGGQTQGSLLGWPDSGLPVGYRTPLCVIVNPIREHKIRVWFQTGNL